jgi:hypothetical protein
MLHSISSFRRGAIEFEVNPQWLRTEGSNGFGLHGLFNVTVNVGRAKVVGGTFIFYDALEGYVQGRINGRVIIPLGR